jgi:hypothetical protein
MPKYDEKEINIGNKEKYEKAIETFNEFYDEKIREKDKHLEMSYILKEATKEVLEVYQKLGNEVESLSNNLNGLKKSIDTNYKNAKAQSEK